VNYFRTGFGKDLSEVPAEGIFKAYIGLAKALVELKQGDEALQLVREDAQKNIQNVNTLKELEANVCMELKQYDDVIAIYEWLLASDPDNRGYLLGSSIVYDLAGQFKDAEKALLKVLEQSPEDPLALNNLAYMYLENNVNPSKALKMVQQALILEPNNGAYLDTLGWAYYKLGKYKDARKHIERALKWADKEDRGVIYDHYGDILAKMKNSKEALDAYRKAIESGEDESKIIPKINSISQ
jgi:tetratricopeptide (TPR) repeat protein